MSLQRARGARFTGAAVGIVVALVAVLAFAGQGSAAPPAGLGVRVQASDPLAPALVLTNQSGAACQIVTSALGTVGVSSLIQGGTPVTPLSVDPSFPDGLDVYLAGTLRTLAPGQSATIALSVVPLGPTGHALQTVTWSTAASLGALYPIRAGSPLRLSVSYAPPPIAVSGRAPLCPAVANGATGTQAGASDRTLLIALGGLVCLLLVGAAVVGLVMLGRTRRRSTATVATGLVLVLGAALVLQLATAHPADATVTVDPSLSGAYGPCASLFTGAGGDPAGILPTLNNPAANVKIVPANGDQTHEISVGGQLIIFWDPNDHHAYTGGGNADPCGSLYHEMYHGYEDLNGGQDHSPCVTAAGPSGLPVNEVNATKAQNKLRVKQGLPPRKTYGNTPLPDGPCLPPSQQPKPKPTCTGAGCGDSNGDPHLTTFDGLRYDFQAAGEFIAARDTASPASYQIQIRQQPVPGSQVVAVTTAIAMAVAGDRIEVRLQPPSVALIVDGAPAALSATTLPHGGTVAMDSTGNAPVLTVHWPDGSAAAITPIGVWGLHLTAQPAAVHAGTLIGLLGDFNGSRENDLRTPAGTPLAQAPTFGALYPAFADSWRITAATSMFTYPAGASTATYTDRSFPHQPANVANAPTRTTAAALCQRLGITDTQTLADCTLDVALTGQADFAEAALATQQALAATPTPGPTTTTTLGTSSTEATMRITTPNATAKLTFPGTAGQRLFVDILTTDLPDQCGVLYLTAPDGATIGGACVGHGTGYLDGTLLPTTGAYTLILRPDTGTGQVHLRLTFSTDTHTTLPTDGSTVVASITAPGQLAFLAFAGTAGQRVFVQTTGSTLPGQCALPALRGPDGSTLAAGCVESNGSGYLDGTLLPSTGQYTVVVDPAERQTGQVTLRLITSQDQHATATIGGPAVTATIAAPGQEAFFTVNAKPGQKISVAVSSTTLTAACGIPRLLAPNGATIAAGCITASGTSGIDPITLTIGGTYTVVVDPEDAQTGQVTFAVRAG